MPVPMGPSSSPLVIELMGGYRTEGRTVWTSAHPWCLCCEPAPVAFDRPRSLEGGLPPAGWPTGTESAYWNHGSPT